MKCIHCGKDANYKTRQKNQGRCSSCGQPFAFEPQKDPLKVTDRLFEQAINDVSGGAIFFTERQLWYALDNRLSSKELSYRLRGLWRRLAGAGDRQMRTRHLTLELQAFSEYLRRWNRVHGRPDKLLDSPLDGKNRESRAGHEEAPLASEPDLTAYSFDRAVVADRAEIAAMLVANDFHFENNCAVLSLDGYPFGRAEIVLAMLRRNPGLQVFAVHDASAAGCALPLKLRKEPWFPDPSVAIVDLGLRPRHAYAMSLPMVTSLPRKVDWELQKLLSPEDAKWLEAGNTAELAALRPSRLLRAIYQGFAARKSIPAGAASQRQAQPEGGSLAGASYGFLLTLLSFLPWIHISRGTDVAAAEGQDDTGLEFETDVWAYDEDADIYAADSFG